MTSPILWLFIYHSSIPSSLSLSLSPPSPPPPPPPASPFSISLSLSKKYHFLSLEMVSEDQYNIAVPSFFRCPISLDLMKSPVSLCTGVTYDRSSIQRWLDGGNNTCPATMQVPRYLFKCIFQRQKNSN